jgi:hypothetical protein
MYHELTFYIDNYRYRDKDESYDRLELATDAQKLYCDLCAYFDVRYGAAWSNYNYEEVIRDLHRAIYGHLELSYHENLDKLTFRALMDGYRFDAEIYNEQPPSALFWVQYFSREYAGHIDLEACVRLGGKLIHLQKGVLLTFFDYPWEVDFRRLLAINEQWRKLNSV